MRGDSVLTSGIEKVNHLKEKSPKPEVNSTIKARISRGAVNIEAADEIVGLVSSINTAPVFNTNIRRSNNTKTTRNEEGMILKIMDKLDKIDGELDKTNSDNNRYESTPEEMDLFDEIASKDSELRTDLEKEFLSLYDDYDAIGNIPLPDIKIVNDLIDRINEEREIEKFDSHNSSDDDAEVLSSVIHDMKTIDSDNIEPNGIKLESQFIEERKKEIADQY